MPTTSFLLFPFLNLFSSLKSLVENAFISIIDLIHVFKFIADKENGFVTFFISDKKLDAMINDVFENGGEPPVNKKRKIIFKPWTPLTQEDKMRIVGELIGRSKHIDEKAIYQCMLDLNEYGKKITVGRVADLLNCSTRTIHRNMCKELNKEKQYLNNQL